MRLPTVQQILAVALSLQWGAAWAASPAIGTVVAKGAFRVDNATASANATLFEGSTLETQQGTSAIALQSGAKLQLGAGSRGRLFGDRLLLERGSTQIDNGIGFHVEALGLTVQPDRAAATGRLLIQNGKLQVASLTGGFRVLNASRQVIANLPPGTLLAFEPQAGSSSQTRVTGCLEARSGRYLVTDQTTNVTVEVTGNGLPPEAGNRVELTGQMDPSATPTAGATQLIRVSSVRRLEKGCGSGAAAAGAGGAAAGGAAGGGAAASGAGGGITAGTIAIIGGVAAGAAIGGLAAADALPGQGDGESRSPASR